jgi:5-methylcytosine-specific restriction endonuclease McrA
MEKSDIIKKITEALLYDSKEKAEFIIKNEYPFEKKEIFHRSYYLYQKMKIFIRDGFIDRYTGDKLVNPGILKVLSFYFPQNFPYQKNWKMSESHIGYLELAPTIDHLEPIAAGGSDTEDNQITTSMFNNSIKSNWTLKQLRWTLHEKGNIDEWDGLTKLFIKSVDSDQKLKEDNYILNWYKASLKFL